MLDWPLSCLPPPPSEEDDEHGPPLIESNGSVWHTATAEATAQPRSGLHSWTLSLAAQVRLVMGGGQGGRSPWPRRCVW